MKTETLGHFGHLKTEEVRGENLEERGWEAEFSRLDRVIDLGGDLGRVVRKRENKIA